MYTVTASRNNLRKILSRTKDVSLSNYIINALGNTNGYKTKAYTLNQVKLGRWYQYTSTKVLYFKSATGRPVTLKEGDFFCLSEQVGNNIIMYKQGMPRVFAFIPIQEAGALLRIGRPVHRREAQFTSKT